MAVMANKEIDPADAQFAGGVENHYPLTGLNIRGIAAHALLQ
jgi:hypothetical protein